MRSAGNPDLAELGRRLVAALELGDVTIGARDLHELAGAYDPSSGTIEVDPRAEPADVALALLDGLVALAGDPTATPHARPRLRVVRDGTG